MRRAHYVHEPDHVNAVRICVEKYLDVLPAHGQLFARGCREVSRPVSIDVSRVGHVDLQVARVSTMRSLEAMESSAGSRVRFLVSSATDDPLRYDGPNVIRDLSRSRKRISPVYVYDKKQLPICSSANARRRSTTSGVVEAGYYDPTRAKSVERCARRRSFELGAGTADKTGILFRRVREAGLALRLLSIDVDTETRWARRRTGSHRLILLPGSPLPRDHGTRTGYAACPRALNAGYSCFSAVPWETWNWEEMEAFLDESSSYTLRQGTAC